MISIYYKIIFDDVGNPEDIFLIYKCTSKPI